MTLHNVGDVVLGPIASASVVFRFMPPPSKFAGWPRLQKWYSLLYVIVQWVAFNK